MPILMEKATTQVVILAQASIVVGNAETKVGAVIDTSLYDSGIYFAAMTTAWTTTGFSLVIYEDSAIGMGTESIVGAANLIYTSPALDVTAITTEGGTMPKLGCFGTKRYIRCKLVGDATCAATGVVVAIANPTSSLKTAQGGNA